MDSKGRNQGCIREPEYWFPVLGVGSGGAVRDVGKLGADRVAVCSMIENRFTRFFVQPVYLMSSQQHQRFHQARPCPTVDLAPG